MTPSFRSSLARFRGFSRNVWLYLISNTIQSVTAGAAGVLYTLFLNDLYGVGFVGAALFVATVGGALAIVPASALTHRLGWRAMLLWSDYIGGVAILLQIIAPMRWVILLTSLGIGASVAIFLVLNGPFLAACSAPEQRNTVFAVNNAFAWLAAVVGALLGGLLPVWLASVNGSGASSGPLAWLAPALETARPLLLGNPQARVYQVAMLLSGVVALPSIIPVYLMHDLPSPPVPVHRVDRTSSVALLRTSEGKIGRGLPARVANWLPWAREIATGLIGRFAFSQMLIGLGAGLVFPFLSIYFVDKLHATTAYYGALTSAVTAGLALVSLISAPLADRFGQIRLAVVVQIASLPLMALLGFVPILWVASIAYVLRSMLINTGSAPEQAWLMDATPPERRVLASNVYNASWQGAWAVGAAVGGSLITIAGYGSAFTIATVLYALSALLMILWLLPKRGSANAPAVREAEVETLARHG
jgi:MFS family permease